MFLVVLVILEISSCLHSIFHTGLFLRFIPYWRLVFSLIFSHSVVATVSFFVHSEWSFSSTMSAKAVTMSAKDATMSAKDATMSAKGRDHERQGRDHERQRRRP